MVEVKPAESKAVEGEVGKKAKEPLFSRQQLLEFASMPSSEVHLRGRVPADPEGMREFVRKDPYAAIKVLNISVEFPRELAAAFVDVFEKHPEFQATCNHLKYQLSDIATGGASAVRARRRQDYNEFGILPSKERLRDPFHGLIRRITNLPKRMFEDGN